MSLPPPLLLVVVAGDWSPDAGTGGGLPPPLALVLLAASTPDLTPDTGPLGGLPPPLAWLVYAGDSGLTPDTEPADDLFIALASWLDTVPVVTTALPGGLVNTRAPAVETVPFARLGEVDPVRPMSLDDQAFEIAISTYDVTDDAAKSAGVALANALLGRTATRPTLRFLHDGETWIEAGVRRLPESRFVSVGRTEDGVELIRWDQAFEVIARREDDQE